MTSATPEELAAVLAALAARRPAEQQSSYELWRRGRIAALRRRR